jgi:hypothetical protein
MWIVAILTMIPSFLFFPLAAENGGSLQNPVKRD